MFLANVQDEPRPWLARLVLLGARGVTAMVVGSGALLGFCSIVIEPRRNDSLVLTLALQPILQITDGNGQLVIIKLTFIVELICEALLRNRQHLLDGSFLPQTGRELVIGERAERLWPGIPHSLDQAAVEVRFNPRSDNLCETEMLW
jgi:hypothetical protein